MKIDREDQSTWTPILTLETFTSISNRFIGLRHTKLHQYIIPFNIKHPKLNIFQLTITVLTQLQLEVVLFFKTGQIVQITELSPTDRTLLPFVLHTCHGHHIFFVPEIKSPHICCNRRSCGLRAISKIGLALSCYQEVTSRIDM
jgi:hypothetical protein